MSLSLSLSPSSKSRNKQTGGRGSVLWKLMNGERTPSGISHLIRGATRVKGGGWRRNKVEKGGKAARIKRGKR